MIYILIWIEEDLDKLKSRDKSALTRLYDQYKDSVLNFLIIKLKGNKEIAEEIFCDTFHSVIESIHNLKNLNNIQGWLIRIANNKYSDYFRREFKHIKHQDNSVNNEEVSSNENIHEQLEKKQEVLLLDMAINAVKGEYREVLKLKYIDKKSCIEIAGTLKKSVSSINNLLLRSKKALKTEFYKLLKEGYNEI